MNSNNNSNRTSLLKSLLSNVNSGKSPFEKGQTMSESIKRAEQGLVTGYHIDEDLLQFTHKMRSSIFFSKNVFFLLGTIPTLYTIISMLNLPGIEPVGCFKSLKTAQKYWGGYNQVYFDDNLEEYDCAANCHRSNNLTMYQFFEVMNQTNVKFDSFRKDLYLTKSSLVIYGLAVLVLYIIGVFYMSRLLRMQKYRLRMFTASVNVPPSKTFIFSLTLLFMFLATRYLFYDRLSDIVGTNYVYINCDHPYMTFSIDTRQYKSLTLLFQSSSSFCSFMLVIYGCSSITKFLNEKDFSDLVAKGVRAPYKALVSTRHIEEFYIKYPKKSPKVLMLGMIDYLNNNGLLVSYDYYEKTLLAQEEAKANKSIYSFVIILLNVISASYDAYFSMSLFSKDVSTWLYVPLTLAAVLCLNFAVARKSIFYLRLYVLLKVIYWVYLIATQGFDLGMMAIVGLIQFITVMFIYGICCCKEDSLLATLRRRNEQLKHLQLQLKNINANSNRQSVVSNL